MSGKGSQARPFSVDRDTFSDNWDRIFSKRFSWICSHCGRDRLKETCMLDGDLARMLKECPMTGEAQ
jgi:hypothetical protein